MLRAKCYRKHIWRGSPFLSQLIKPFSQRPTQGAVRGASASPGWRSTLALGGSTALLSEHAQAATTNTDCRAPPSHSLFFSQSTPSSFKQCTGTAAMGLSWSQVALIQGTDTEDTHHVRDPPGQPAPSSWGQLASRPAHGIRCTKLPRDTCPCLPGRPTDVSILCHIAT